MRDTGRIDDNDLPTRVGDFSWQLETGTRHLTMLLPCGHHATLPVEGARAWQWDGNADEPTLLPSILCLGGRRQCGWHGFMTAGKLEPCPGCHNFPNHAESAPAAHRGKRGQND